MAAVVSCHVSVGVRRGQENSAVPTQFAPTCVCPSKTFFSFSFALAVRDGAEMRVGLPHRDSLSVRHFWRVGTVRAVGAGFGPGLVERATK